MEVMESIRLVLAHNMKNLRKQRKMNQETLAERARLSVGMIKNIELGKRWPSPATTEAIAKGLGVTVGELFSGKERLTSINILPPMSEALKAAMTVPDRVYLLARELDDVDNREWETVFTALEEAIEEKKKKATKANRA